MAQIPEHTDPTLAAVDVAIEEAQDRKHRPYLGMSGIGHPCERKCWYDFRWATPINHEALTLKLFDDGNRGEDVQAERLRMVAGLELHTHTDDGRQFGFEDIGGHFRGNMDGAIHGLVQAPKTWHVWEHKQSSEKKQAELSRLKADKGEKDALAAWNEIYYAQAVLYMEYSGMTRHYLTCATPGGRHTISVRTNANKAEAAKLKDKARRVIFAAEPPLKLSERPDWYQCQWCDHKSICHYDRLPRIVCRTCAHVTPCEDGTWHCAMHSQVLSEQTQRVGCGDHLYIPALVSYGEMVDADSAARCQWVRYRHKKTENIFYNRVESTTPPALNEPAYTSAELHFAEPDAIGEDFVEDVRNLFSATQARLEQGEDFNDSLNKI